MQKFSLIRLKISYNKEIKFILSFNRNTQLSVVEFMVRKTLEIRYGIKVQEIFLTTEDSFEVLNIFTADILEDNAVLFVNERGDLDKEGMICLKEVFMQLNDNGRIDPSNIEYIRNNKSRIDNSRIDPTRIDYTRSDYTKIENSFDSFKIRQQIRPPLKKPTPIEEIMRKDVQRNLLKQENNKNMIFQQNNIIEKHKNQNLENPNSNSKEKLNLSNKNVSVNKADILNNSDAFNKPNAVNNSDIFNKADTLNKTDPQINNSNHTNNFIQIKNDNSNQTKKDNSNHTKNSIQTSNIFQSGFKGFAVKKEDLVKKTLDVAEYQPIKKRKEREVYNEIIF